MEMMILTECWIFLTFLKIMEPRTFLILISTTWAILNILTPSAAFITVKIASKVINIHDVVLDILLFPLKYSTRYLKINMTESLRISCKEIIISDAIKQRMQRAINYIMQIYFVKFAFCR